MYKRLALKESLFLGFCAVFILLTRVIFRLHLSISGHVMFFTVLFLMIARGSVAYSFAATFTALLAGVGAMVLGIGRGDLSSCLNSCCPDWRLTSGPWFSPECFKVMRCAPWLERLLHQPRPLEPTLSIRCLVWTKLSFSSTPFWRLQQRCCSVLPVAFSSRTLLRGLNPMALSRTGIRGMRPDENLCLYR